MMGIGLKHTPSLTQVSCSSQPWVSREPQAPDSLPTARGAVGVQEGEVAAPRVCTQGDPLLCGDLGKGGMGNKNFPTWAKPMGTKPCSLSPDCRGGGNLSSAPRRLNGLLKNPFVLDPFFFPKLAGSAPRGNL